MALEFIGFTYVSNFLTPEIEEVIFQVLDEANRKFYDWDLPLRFLYIDKMTLEPGYLITVDTPGGRVKLYPLEVLIDLLDYRLKVEVEKRDGILMNKILGLVGFPLASRNRYFDFYESFLGFQAKRLERRIMVLSIKPFEGETAGKRKIGERLLKGILHEIGHAFGLTHCSSECVMNPPSNLSEWDKRPLRYCESCLRKLRFQIGDNILSWKFRL